MADYSRISYTALYQQVSQRLQQAGLDNERALIEAKIMAEADLLEVPSHGVRTLPGLLSAIADGRVNAAATNTTVREFGAISVIDCANGSGRYAAIQAMEKAVTQAQAFGVGVCLAKNTSHWGRAHSYAAEAAKRGFIGICTTNAMATMAIGGAKSPVIGNNPVAIGVPSESADKPIVLDIAMSQMAVGKVATYLREGRGLVGDIGLDEKGEPSHDPQKILAGAVLPMGGHKGAGLSLMMEMLTSVLAGTAFGHQLLAGDQSGIDSGASKLFIAINIEAFIAKADYARGVTELLAYLAESASPFNYPSERGWQARDINLVKGVPLHNDIIKQLLSVGIDLSNN